MLSDNELTCLYAQISNFEEFEDAAMRGIDIELVHGVIEFLGDSAVSITLPERTMTLTTASFFSVVRELVAQRHSEVENERLAIENQKKAARERRSKVLTKLSRGAYEAEKEFSTRFFAYGGENRNETYGPFKDLLASILVVFRSGCTLLFDGVLYRSEEQFMHGVGGDLPLLDLAWTELDKVRTANNRL